MAREPHLPYIKPHWPFKAPAPYHDMFGPESFLPVMRSETERAALNPVFGAFMGMKVSETFSQPGVRETLLPANMRLIK